MNEPGAASTARAPAEPGKGLDMRNRSSQKTVTFHGGTAGWRTPNSEPSWATQIGERITPQDDGCWYYSGSHSKQGYAQFKGRAVHRLIYEIVKGDSLPSSMHVHHKCEVKRCVNPAHLMAVPGSTHMRGHMVARHEAADGQ
jgi:hypothetical protein